MIGFSIPNVLKTVNETFSVLSSLSVPVPKVGRCPKVTGNG